MYDEDMSRGELLTFFLLLFYTFCWDTQNSHLGVKKIDVSFNWKGSGDIGCGMAVCNATDQDLFFFTRLVLILSSIFKEILVLCQMLVLFIFSHSLVILVYF